MDEMNARDRKLARRLLAGDERAFDEFFKGNFPGLYRFALTRLDHDHDAAEEVAQATLARAIAKLKTYRGEAALFTWLCTFCRHEISAYFKRHGRQPSTVDLVEDHPDVRAALDSLGAAFGDPVRAFDRSEIARLVQITLDRLPPHYGHALEWKYLDGLPVKEIAARLQLSPKAAESLLTRAREAFRDGFSALTRPPWPRLGRPGTLESS
jgi:RNA polymerase sigma-70 factor (ECF subfamily)